MSIVNLNPFISICHGSHNPSTKPGTRSIVWAIAQQVICTLVYLLPLSVAGQTVAPPSAASAPPLIANSKSSTNSGLPKADGINLLVVTDVDKSVIVDAVLLPQSVC